jgi:ABC-2 type transport system ATP-binding protein
MTAVLEVRGARRDYGEGRGLAGADLTVRAGEIYGLLGPNGAGKTSLVRAIAGRLRLSAGQVRVAGRDPADPAARRALGLVPQEIALYPDLTVRQNLELLGRLAGLPRRAARARVDEALAWIDLADRAASRVATLSGGQKRRVNLAAGTLHDPALLVLDEPTVGVDPPARERLHALLADLRARGAALLLATHDLDQAEQLCDRIGIMVEGAVRAEGAPADLVRAAFGDGRELVVLLGMEPGPAARAALAAAGLAPGADGRAWSGAVPGGEEALPALMAALRASGAVVLETRLREPGLRGVFFRLAGRELDR